MTATFDETKHPRHPAGSSQGGEFAPAGTSGADPSWWKTIKKPLYHLTTRDRVDKILKEGLLNAGPREEAGGASRPGHVYFFSDPRGVDAFWKWGREEFDPSNTVLLAVNPQALNPAKLAADEDYAQFAIDEGIWNAPQWGGDQPLGEWANARGFRSPSEVRESFEQWGSVAYGGKVAPDAIRVAEELDPETGRAWGEGRPAGWTRETAIDPYEPVGEQNGVTLYGDPRGWQEGWQNDPSVKLYPKYEWVRSLNAAAIAWDPAEHPRHPAGTNKGGEFSPAAERAFINEVREAEHAERKGFPPGEFDPDGSVKFWPAKIGQMDGGAAWKAWLDPVSGKELGFWFVTNSGFPHHLDMADALGIAKPQVNEVLVGPLRVSGYGNKPDMGWMSSYFAQDLGVNRGEMQRLESTGNRLHSMIMDSVNEMVSKHRKDIEDADIMAQPMPLAASALFDQLADAEAELQRQYEKVLRRAAKRAATAYRAAMKVVTAAGQPQPEEILAAQALLESFLRVTGLARRNLLNQILEALGVLHADAETPNEALAAYIELLQEQAGVQASRLVAGSQDAVADVLLNAMAEGWPIPQTAKALQEKLESVAPWQATMLARTDLVALANGASLKRAVMLNDPQLQFKTWLATPDERTRIDHRHAHGQTVPITEPFTVGGEQLLYPGDPSASDGNVINCRCTVIYANSPAGPPGVQQIAMKPDLAISAAGWNEADHPREPRGTEEGGRFRGYAAGVDAITWREWDDYAATGLMNEAYQGTLKPGDMDAFGNRVDEPGVRELEATARKIEDVASKNAVYNDDPAGVVPGALWRGMSLPNGSAVLEQFPYRGTWTTGPLTATTTNREIAEMYAKSGEDEPDTVNYGVPVVLRLEGKGQTHRGVQTAPMEVPTNEVVMPAGETYRVQRKPVKKNGIWYVDLYRREPLPNDLPVRRVLEGIRAAAWNETAHPRQPAGSTRGGEFRGAALLTEISRQRAERAAKLGRTEPEYDPVLKGMWSPDADEYIFDTDDPYYSSPVWKAIKLPGGQWKVWTTNKNGFPHHDAVLRRLGYPTTIGGLYSGDSLRTGSDENGEPLNPELRQVLLRHRGKYLDAAERASRALAAAAWDETKHPRYPAGSPQGGEFAPGDTITGRTMVGDHPVTGKVVGQSRFGPVVETPQGEQVTVKESTAEHAGASGIDHAFDPALVAYTANSFALNDALRNERPLTQEEAAQVSALDQLIELKGESSTDDMMTVYRGLPVKLGKQHYTEAGFLSTTEDPDEAEHFSSDDGEVLEIRVPEGMQFYRVPPGAYDMGYDQKEIIFPRGTELRQELDGTYTAITHYLRPPILTAAGWDESAHPRHPPGSEKGGEFAPKGHYYGVRLVPHEGYQAYRMQRGYGKGRSEGRFDFGKVQDEAAAQAEAEAAFEAERLIDWGPAEREFQKFTAEMARFYQDHPPDYFPKQARDLWKRYQEGVLTSGTALAQQLGATGVEGIRLRPELNPSPGGDLDQLTDTAGGFAADFDVSIPGAPGGSDPGFTVWNHADGTREVEDVLDITDTDFFPDGPDSKLVTDYVALVDAARGGVPQEGYVTLYRGMSDAEADAWHAGEEIPTGKFFTSIPTVQYAMDRHAAPPSLFTFKVPRSMVTEVGRNEFQLKKKGKLDRGEIVQASAWDESKHPRDPGGKGGGQWIKKGAFEGNVFENPQGRQYHLPDGEFDPHAKVVFWPNKIGEFDGEPTWKAFMDETGKPLAFWFVDRQGQPHHHDMGRALPGRYSLLDREDLPEDGSRMVEVGGYGDLVDYAKPTRWMPAGPENERERARLKELAQGIPKPHRKDIADARIMMTGPIAAAAVGYTGNGGMVCLYPTEEEAQAIARRKGQAPEDLHVTLLFYPDGVPGDVEKALADLEFTPLKGQISGIGRFAEGEDGVPVVGLVSAPGLGTLRALLAERLPGFSEEYDFLPHMTLGYDYVVDPEGAVGLPVTFSAVKLKSKGEQPVDVLTAASFEEAKHPRHPAGSESGGEFAPKVYDDQVAGLSDELARHWPGTLGMGEFSARDKYEQAAIEQLRQDLSTWDLSTWEERLAQRDAPWAHRLRLFKDTWRAAPEDVLLRGVKGDPGWQEGDTVELPLSDFTTDATIAEGYGDVTIELRSERAFPTQAIEEDATPMSRWIAGGRVKVLSRTPDRIVLVMDEEPLSAAGWSEADHPRWPAGSEKGGEFAPAAARLSNGYQGSYPEALEQARTGRSGLSGMFAGNSESEGMTAEEYRAAGGPGFASRFDAWLLKRGHSPEAIEEFNGIMSQWSHGDKSQELARARIAEAYSNSDSPVGRVFQDVEALNTSLWEAWYDSGRHARLREDYEREKAGSEEPWSQYQRDRASDKEFGYPDRTFDKWYEDEIRWRHNSSTAGSGKLYRAGEVGSGVESWTTLAEGASPTAVTDPDNRWIPNNEETWPELKAHGYRIIGGVANLTGSPGESEITLVNPDRLRALRAAGWSEADHPRWPAGSERGGEFAPKDAGLVSEARLGLQKGGTYRVSKAPNLQEYLLSQHHWHPWMEDVYLSWPNLTTEQAAELRDWLSRPDVKEAFGKRGMGKIRQEAKWVLRDLGEPQGAPATTAPTISPGDFPKRSLLDKLDIGGGKNGPNMLEAARTVDSTMHWPQVPGEPTVEMKGVAGGRSRQAAFWRTRAGVPYAITVAANGQNPVSSTVHELGHYLDSALGQDDWAANYAPDQAAYERLSLEYRMLNVNYNRALGRSDRLDPETGLTATQLRARIRENQEAQKRVATRTTWNDYSSSSASGTLHPVLDALSKTVMYRKLLDYTNGRTSMPRFSYGGREFSPGRAHARYLMKPTEMIARSYEQYIAAKNPGSALGRTTRHAFSDGFFPPEYPGYLHGQDLHDVNDAWEQALKDRGLLKKEGFEAPPATRSEAVQRRLAPA